MAAPLRFANFLSFNLNPTYRAITTQVEQQLGISAEFKRGESFDDFFDETIDVGYICGLPYSKFADMDDPPVELLVAPVLRGDLYAGQPVYFSYLIVPASSSAETIHDLAGTTFYYNEQVSYSGYQVMPWYLQRHGLDWSHFGRLVQSGAHLKSLELVANATADAAAIDSHALDAALQADPSIGMRIRVLDAIGPSPHPPVVTGRNVGVSLKRQLCDFYLNLHTIPVMRSWLAQAHIDRFVAVDDAFYDPIRRRVDVSKLRFSRACGVEALRKK